MSQSLSFSALLSNFGGRMKPKKYFVLFKVRVICFHPELPKMWDYNVCGRGNRGRRRNRSLVSWPAASLSGLRFIKHCDTFISVNPEYFIPVQATRSVAGDMRQHELCVCVVPLVTNTNVTNLVRDDTWPGAWPGVRRTWPPGHVTHVATIQDTDV